jgi:hypothetical protein
MGDYKLDPPHHEPYDHQATMRGRAHDAELAARAEKKVPDEVIEEAVKAARAACENAPVPVTVSPLSFVRETVEAAFPVIAKAERDRIKARIERAADYYRREAEQTPAAEIMEAKAEALTDLLPLAAIEGKDEA